MDSLKAEPEISEKKEKAIIKALRKIIYNKYLQFVIKKAIFYSVVLFIAITIAFIIPRLLPGDPLRSIITPPPGATDEQIEAFLERREQLINYLGLDKPLVWIYICAGGKDDTHN